MPRQCSQPDGTPVQSVFAVDPSVVSVLQQLLLADAKISGRAAEYSLTVVRVPTAIVAQCSHTESGDVSRRLDTQIRTAVDDVVREVLGRLRPGTASGNRYITPVDSDVPGSKAVLHGPHGRSTTSSVACRHVSRVGLPLSLSLSLSLTGMQARIQSRPLRSTVQSESACQPALPAQRRYCRVAGSHVIRPIDGALTCQGKNDA
jgi:hypothetical protein